MNLAQENTRDMIRLAERAEGFYLELQRLVTLLDYLHHHHVMEWTKGPRHNQYSIGELHRMIEEDAERLRTEHQVTEDEIGLIRHNFQAFRHILSDRWDISTDEVVKISIGIHQELDRRRNAVLPTPAA